MLIATGLLIEFFLVLLIASTEAVTWHELKAALGKRRHLQWVRDLRPLVQDQLLYAGELSLGEKETFHDVLRNILVPRTVGSQGHRKVRQFLRESMEQLHWHVEEDKFEAPTPHGNKVFSNIVATLDPSACHRLVLACHYDSMVHKGGVFLGATDSAVPCAQLIYLATVLDDKLKEQKRRGDGLTLQFIFFDGEEAFVRWSSSDSLYGSRHLASLWHRNSTQGYNLEGCLPRSDITTQIDRMEVMVLLDLLGAPEPRFYSYFLDTRPVYDRLVDIESRLNDMDAMETRCSRCRTNYFINSSQLALIEDDHIPFLRKNVPIVHVIPNPFPSVWHTLDDNAENLDHSTINNLNKIFKAFLTEYLRL
ncbi:glutaminyl-peptide cyclotransferase-like isoform X1 [Dermacentor albipictus]|uniref:glutaminyl-peptide cyclotransferase-like isoform X1 n=1 Tax=Dermacentor albipictus TaxID=60249 RepID=UPI0038FC0096